MHPTHRDWSSGSPKRIGIGTPSVDFLSIPGFVWMVPGKFTCRATSPHIDRTQADGATPPCGRRGYRCSSGGRSVSGTGGHIPATHPRCRCGSRRHRIDWRPRHDPADFANFVVHYYESTGVDFGWHREPNPHVDGLAHFQTRNSQDEEYEYEPAYFVSDSPVELHWVIVARLERRVSTESI